LKTPIDFGHKTFTDSLKGPANVHGTNSLFATDRLLSQKTIRQMCSTISRQPSNKNFFMFRSILVYGFCPDNLSPESSRHRNLSSSNAAKTLSLRNPRKCFPHHLGKGERKSRLANTRRLRPSVDKQSLRALRRRRVRRSIENNSLCFGLNDHRFMSVTISMGKVSQTQSRSQGSHANGPKRLYTHFYPHYRRKSPRRKYTRRTDFRAWCNLHNGSRLPRLCSSLYLHSKPFNFCYKSQEQFRLSSSLLSQGRQNNWPSVRPGNKTQWLLCIAGLSCGSSSNLISRHRDKQKIRILNEQFCFAGIDYCTTLQVPLADRNLFQMDQAIPANQNILRHHQERCEDSNLDCYQRLCLGGDCQERAQNRAEFGRNLANSQHCTFRESSYYASTYENYVAKQKLPVS